MKLTSTRLNANQHCDEVSFSQAILSPIGAHGGLYAPQHLPHLDEDFFNEARQIINDKGAYKKLALRVIKAFDFDLDLEIFERALRRYDSFDDGEPTHLNEINGYYFNELWHGPTRAFKDMALAPFGALLEELASNQKYLIIVATSGDTGPATLEAFGGSKNVSVVCMYPSGGTSQTQKLQMLSYSRFSNSLVLGIRGNFDDAQRTLKALLGNDDFKNVLKAKGFKLSAANSVNFGRILFQIIYHLYASIKIASQNPVNIVVPSGNFGDALGAYYAKKMGANIAKIGIASNENNVLTDFINTGIYDISKRTLKQTISPAMDILISSNIERVLFDLFGALRTKELMDALNEHKKYALSKDELKSLQEIFYANYCNDDECAGFIREFAKMGALIDPHTATALKIAKKGDIIASTAQWVKFTPSMINAIKNAPCVNEKEQMNALSSEFNVKLPAQISALFENNSWQEKTCHTDEIQTLISEWLK